MKKLLILLAFLATSCTVNPSKLDPDYAKKFADRINCAVGHQDKCWCFVASWKTGGCGSTGIGMTLAPDEMCKK